MNVLLATEKADLRLAVGLYLSEEPGITITGTASEAASLLALLGTTRANLVLLDWDLPGHPPARLLAEARCAESHPEIIVLGHDLEIRPAALAAGADGFVLKGDPPGHLLTAVRGARSRWAARTPSTPSEQEGE